MTSSPTRTAGKIREGRCPPGAFVRGFVGVGGGFEIIAPNLAHRGNQTSRFPEMTTAQDEGNQGEI
jgi:hypothetical protein